ncbi:amidohydrolase [Siminovitchia sediminis]|uniref:Amidohydrolase n=1 Tax=Siminovitchia sediminis TaxID=1274353 RepID=A0ABW4KNT7_9BACI
MTKVLYKNAKVYTLNSSEPIADSFIVDETDGTFAWVGNASEAENFSNVYDLGGATVLPGFVDAHTHLEVTAISRYINVDCRYPTVKSIVEIQRKIKERVASLPPGEWVVAQGVNFQDSLLEENRFPTKEDLDAISTVHPIVYRPSFHMAILNSKALELANITRDTPDPPGGIIERDIQGEPNGVTRDVEHYLLGIPEPSREEQQRAYMHCIQNDFLARGVTSLFEISHTKNSLRNLAAINSPLRIGVYVHVPGTADFEEALNGLPDYLNGNNPFFAGVKVFIDGGTTALAAAYNEPYAIDPSTSGKVAIDIDELFGYLKSCDNAEIPLVIHAVGDRAQDIVIEAMERLTATGKRQFHVKHRIEHGGNVLCTPERQRKFKEVGLIPVPNPSFIMVFGDALGKYLGERRTQYAYPFKSMIENGLEPASGGDCAGAEMRSANPWFNIWCTINRKTQSGKVLHPEEAIDLMDALRMHTIWSAKACGVEDKVGSIETGKFADFILLEEDIFFVPVEELKDILPLETWIGGKLIKGKKEQRHADYSH